MLLSPSIGGTLEMEQRPYPVQIGVILHRDFTEHMKMFRDMGIDVFHDSESKLLRYGLDPGKNVILGF
jgi:hypothetical protein